MEHIITRRRGFRKLLAFLLCMASILGLLPAQAFAMSVGQTASSWLGDQYVGSDGNHYRAPAPYTYLAYHADGTIDVHTSSGGNAYRHYMLTDSDGISHQVYCVESGIPYHTSENTYVSESGTNSQYLNLLPAEARRGITLTAIYGWKPGATLPVSGINEDDYKMATQIILWEYQQQLRSDPYNRHGNGHADGDQYFSVIAGRPAEKAYDWILAQVASHSTVPSFTSSKKSEAPELELKWDVEKKVYTLTVTDTNNLKIDLEALKGSGVSVTRNGNEYTFTSRQMMMDPVLFEFRKNIPVANDMLIWGRPGYQTMMTGASDPVSFFVKIKTETYGTAKLVKTSEDGIVSGITFHISGTDILGNEVNEEVTTGENGQIEKKLLPGTYLVKELPVDRYVTPSAQYVTIESGQTSSVHFSNILKKFRVHVVKSDADTGNAQGDATLAGATYGIFRDGELIDTYTTGPDGSFMTRYYVCGDNWTIREIEPSTGYLLNETVYEVGASPSLYEVELNTTENQVTETVIYGNIQLVKHTDDLDPDVPEGENTDDPNAGIIERPEAGAVFEIYLKAAGSYDAAKESERDLLTTDADGFASSKPLPYGHYTVHQIAGEEGKAFVPDFTVFISSDGKTYSYILNNRTITARLKVEKCDAETGKIIPVTGTGFQIKDLSTGEFITQTVYYPNPETLNTFYVSDEGWLMLPEPLAAGDYELYEVAAPYGYVLSDQPVPFTIDGSEAVVTVTQYNMPQKGQLTITKTGEVFASVQENDGLYQPVYEVAGLPGAVYDVIADEDIYTGDGTLRAEKDTVVETLTTGEDGTAKSGSLYLGRYRLEERQAPSGCVLNPQPEYVELTYAGETVEVTQTAAGLYDERQKVDVTLFKAMETDDLFGLGMNEEYKDISFGLYASADLTAADGSVIPAGGLLEVVSVSSEESGGYSASFASDLPFGSYYVKERTTNGAYILSNQEYPVVFEYAGQETALVQILVNEGEAVYYFSITEDGQVAVVENGEAGHGFTNEAYRGNLKITKDSSDGRKDGFAIEVKSADGSYCETFTTPKSGVIEVKGLRVGIYTVTEVANRASKDYIIPDAATVEIKADQTSTVQFFNEKPEKPDNPKNPEKPSVPSNPSTPQKPVPQTGDDPYIFLYGGLLAAALIGGSVFAVYYFKKGKYSRTSLKRTAVGVSVLSLCVLVALGSGFLVFRDLNQYAESKDAYRDLAGYVEVPEQTASPESAPDPTEPKRDDTDIVLPSVDFETLRENGPDIIGWLSLPDTVLNYPVTQTDNNEYYLNHLYDGTYNKVGCLFADYENRADFSDRNTIIYGHNMRDGSMFALLNRYDEQSYFDAHRQMYLVTPKGGYVMEIFAAFAAKPEESGSETSPWQLSWKDDGAYTTWLTAMKERSAVESDVTVTCSDKVLTLSTCTPGGTGRFLVMGKLVKVDNEI